MKKELKEIELQRKIQKETKEWQKEMMKGYKILVETEMLKDLCVWKKRDREKVKKGLWYIG